MPIRPVDVMSRHDYDPDGDLKIALAQIVDAACSEAEAAALIATHAGDPNGVPSIPASRVTSLHFPLARMPDLALNKIMVGQGAGSDPVAETVHTASDTAALIATHAADPNGVPNIPASRISSLHFPLARMPDLALNKIMVGQGVGSDPVAEDKAVVLTFTEYYGATHNVTTGTIWEDWDLSSIVPAGTVYVLIQIYNVQSVSKSHGVRKNGSADLRRFTQGAYGSICVLTEVDASRVLEVYCDSSDQASGEFRVVGYWS